MVGMYDEIARLMVLRVEPAEWSPAAWKGAIAREDAHSSVHFGMGSWTSYYGPTPE